MTPACVEESPDGLGVTEEGTGKCLANVDRFNDALNQLANAEPAESVKTDYSREQFAYFVALPPYVFADTTVDYCYVDSRLELPDFDGFCVVSKFSDDGQLDAVVTVSGIARSDLPAAVFYAQEDGAGRFVQAFRHVDGEEVDDSVMCLQDYVVEFLQRLLVELERRG